MAILWLLGFFVLRNGWFSLFEMGGRGATPGKRLMGLRVVARDGARLTGGAVIARNAMREIEVFLPMSFLFQQAAAGHRRRLPHPLRPAVERHLPVLPAVQPRPAADRRPRRRHLGGPLGPERALGADLVHGVERPRRTFSEAALNLYGVYELQTLEDVLRAGRDDAIATVAWTIRNKAGIHE